MLQILIKLMILNNFEILWNYMTHLLKYFVTQPFSSLVELEMFVLSRWVDIIKCFEWKQCYSLSLSILTAFERECFAANSLSIRSKNLISICGTFWHEFLFTLQLLSSSRCVSLWLEKFLNYVCKLYGMNWMVQSIVNGFVNCMDY